MLCVQGLVRWQEMNPTKSVEQNLPDCQYLYQVAAAQGIQYITNRKEIRSSDLLMYSFIL